MALHLQISIIVGVLLFFIVIFYFIKKSTLALKYSLLWIFAGFVMLILAVFPGIMNGFIKLVGIESLTNGLFALLVFFILIILMSLTAILSKMKSQNKQLIQSCALLEKRVRELEESSKLINN